MTSQMTDGRPDELLSSAVQQVSQLSKTLNLHITHHEERIDDVQQKANSVIADARAELEQFCQSVLADADARLEAGKAELAAQFADVVAAVRQEAAAYLSRLEENHRQQVAEIAADGEAQLELLRSEIAAGRQQFAAERERMETAHREAGKSQRQTLTLEHRAALETGLEATRRERAEQQDEYENLRQKTVDELNGQLSQALETGAENYQSALSEATAQLNAEHQRSNDAAVSGINTTWTKFTRILIGVTGISSAVAVAALVVALL